ncbi:MAG: hypothetical protein IJ371_02240 [Clostridia bacterium]|nr:hypothetical protein [Clostridia bacterium]
MDKTKTQDKFLKLLELLNGCREKLYATYNLFVSNVEQTKTTKAELGEKYEQLLDLRHEFVQLTSSSKPAKIRISKVRKDSQLLKAEYDNQFATVGGGMIDCESCRKTYKHEVALCCDTYNKLKVGGVEEHIVKGYKQQVKLIKRILEKIDTAKISFKALREEIKQQKQMFDELYNKINDQVLALN